MDEHGVIVAAEAKLQDIYLGELRRKGLISKTKLIPYSVSPVTEPFMALLENLSPTLKPPTPREVYLIVPWPGNESMPLERVNPEDELSGDPTSTELRSHLNASGSWKQRKLKVLDLHLRPLLVWQVLAKSAAYTSENRWRRVA